MPAEQKEWNSRSDNAAWLNQRSRFLVSTNIGIQWCGGNFQAGKLVERPLRSQKILRHRPLV